jgi:hypothetical protein
LYPVIREQAEQVVEQAEDLVAAESVVAVEAESSRR